jgi:hypothetical protein
MSSASPSNIACLKLKQKAAVRIVLGANYNDRTEPTFYFWMLYANSLTYSLCSISYRIFCLTHLIICSLLMPIEEMPSSTNIFDCIAAYCRKYTYIMPLMSRLQLRGLASYNCLTQAACGSYLFNSNNN